MPSEGSSREERVYLKTVKISVVIPAYNVEDYITESLESVLEQSLREIEVIVVDDGSTDKTKDIIKQYAKTDVRLKLIEHQSNGGTAKSRNDGIKAASGEYLYNFDSDDRLKEDALKKMYETASKNNLDVLSFSGETFVDESLKNTGKYHNYVNRKDAYRRFGLYSDCVSGPELFAQFLDNSDPIGNWCLHLIRREVFVDNNLFINSDLGWDEDDLFPTYLVCKRAMCISDILYARRYRGGSTITSKKTMRKAENSMIRMVKDLELWEKANLSDDINERIKKYFLISQRIIINLLHELDDEEKGKGYEILGKYPVANYIMDYLIRQKSKYSNLNEEVLDEIKSSNNIVLYGAGMVAQDVADLLESWDIKDYRVAVTKKEDDNLTFRGKEVLKREDICWEKTTTIVAFMGRTSQTQVKKYLLERNCQRIIVADI